MGGSSKAANTTTTQTSTLHQTAIDNTSMQGDGVFVKGDGNVIHNSDVDVLKHLGTESMGLIGGIGSGVADIADRSFSAATDLGGLASDLGNRSFNAATDLGGMAAGLGRDAMDYSERSTSTNARLATDLGGMAAGLGRDAMDYSERSVGSISNLAGDFGSMTAGLGRDALDFASRLNSDTLRSNVDVTNQAFKLTDNVSYGLMQLANNSNQTAADSSKSAMSLVENFTRREQTGTEGEAIRWVVIAAVGVAGFSALQMMGKK